MFYTHNLLLLISAVLLSGVSWLMRRSAGSNLFLHNFSVVSLAISVVVGAVSLGLIMAQ